MRMWMVNPKIMCNQHLLGEHVELHMFVGTLKKRISIEGYVRNGLVEPKSIISRHKQLAEEMKQRGMHHKSPLKKVNLRYLPKETITAKVNISKSLADLLKRCKRCKSRVKFRI
jgi:hypothetical protein